MSSSSAYGRVVKGKLSFKGQKKAVKSSGSSGSSGGKQSRGGTAEAQIRRDAAGTEAVSAEGGGPRAEEQQEEELVERQGTGRITSSGTTVYGHFTEFAAQLSPGDAIIITHPTTLQQETKIVRMVLSNISMGISSSFSTDLISTTAFKYIKAPRDDSKEREAAALAVQKRHKGEEDAFGTYASRGGEQLVYREKKSGGSGGGSFGGYKIVKQTLDGSASREQLLDMRAKKKSDRFCY